MVVEVWDDKVVEVDVDNIDTVVEVDVDVDDVDTVVEVDVDDQEVNVEDTVDVVFKSSYLKTTCLKLN